MKKITTLLFVLFVAINSFGKDCSKLKIDDFIYFSFFKYNQTETDLLKTLNNLSKKELSTDFLSMIYSYTDTKRFPFHVYVNTQTKKIETIFVEVLGYDENFPIDLKNGVKNYKIEECHASIFGKKPEDIIAMWGKTDYDYTKANEVEDDVRTMIYYSTDNKLALTLKFYPSQGYILSSIMIDWFYDLLPSKTTNIKPCNELKVEKFSSFLGFNYETTKDLDVVKVLGEPYTKSNSSDNFAFIYYYKFVSRVPLTIYFNNETKAIETILIEVLGKNEYLGYDVQHAINNYNLSLCDAYLFNQTASKIKEILGVPNEDYMGINEVEDNVNVLIYYSSDNKIQITLKFYPSQNSMLSSIMIDWYYD